VPDDALPTPPILVEFPADDPERALRFWEGVLATSLAPRRQEQGEGWQSDGDGAALGLHPRATGPGDRVSLPYFAVADVAAAVARVSELGGTVIHAGERWTICRDSEGSPFGLGPVG
jgi:predicted enzyme related to lactoylglutathione lyase